MARWIEATVRVSHGPLEGQPLQLFPWERRALRGIMDPAVQIAAISTARGNGKTGWMGSFVLAHLCCPELQRRRSEILIGSPSREQSKVTFRDVLAYIGEAALADKATWRLMDNQNRSELIHVPTGSRFWAMSSLHRKSHGFRPTLQVIEEPAQLDRAVRDAYFAVAQTSLGKAEGGKLIAIGTAPGGSEPHWFRSLLEGGADYAQWHRIPDDRDVLDARTWPAANPSLRYLPNLRTAIRASARLARKDPAALASFRELRANQGSEPDPEGVLISARAWRSMAEAEDLPDRAGPLIVGVDLAVSGMAGFAAYWPTTGRLEAFGVMPERPSLIARGRADGVGPLYERMAHDGGLLRLGRSTVDVAEAFRVAVRRWGMPTAVVGDRFRFAALRDATSDAGVTAAPVLRGTGYKSAGEDTADFLRAVLERHVRTTPSLIVRSCMAVARTSTDASGNRKLVRRGSGKRKLARDDVAAAVVLAVAVGFRERRAGRIGAGGVRLHVV